jgi:hypothetical protein
MSSMNEKYNLVINKIKDNNRLKASDFNLEYDEFRGIINELEYDGLISDVKSLLDGSFYLTLTFKGKSFLENNDSKEYHKIEKTEIYHNNNLNIENNSGIAVVGNGNTINSSEFNQKFIQLIQEIENSSIGNKAQIIQELNEKKDDKTTLQSSLGTLLTRGAEVATLIPAIGALLGMLG